MIRNCYFDAGDLIGWNNIDLEFIATGSYTYTDSGDDYSGNISGTSAIALTRKRFDKTIFPDLAQVEFDPDKFAIFKRRRDCPIILFGWEVLGELTSGTNDITIATDGPSGPDSESAAVDFILRFAAYTDGQFNCGAAQILFSELSASAGPFTITSLFSASASDPLALAPAIPLAGGTYTFEIEYDLIFDVDTVGTETDTINVTIS